MAIQPAPSPKRGPKPKRDRSALGQALNEERVNQGLTQHEVALRLGCYDQQVRLMEGGEPVWRMLPAYLDLLAQKARKNWTTATAKLLWAAYEDRIWQNLADPVCRIYYLARALDEVAPERFELPTHGLGNRWQLDMFTKPPLEPVTEGFGNELREPDLRRKAA